MSNIAGERLRFGQRDGSEIWLRVFGNESYARYETDDGYSVVYDAGPGMFCHADVVGGQFVSTGVSALTGPPPRLRRYLTESHTVRRDKATSRLRHVHPPEGASLAPGEANLTFGPSAGLLSGRKLLIGEVTGLTILVNFQDVTSTVAQADVDALLNGENYNRNGNVSSAREYFLRVSNNKLDYRNVVVGPYTLSQPRNFYINNLLIKEALDLAVADGLDLRQFDSRNQGIIDALNVMYAGQTQYLGDLWPHNFHINLQYGATRTDLYLLTSMGRSSDDLTIGTFCHENGHLLCRFPDMYDYGSRDGDNVDSEGIGAYCLMGSGNHNNNGRAPSPVCSYLRELAGWCDNIVLLDRPGEFEAPQGDYNTVLKYKSARPNEYFIVENRSKMGLDAHLPASGLAIYHCDILGSNEYQSGAPDRHYQCALLQADGQLDLERNVNRGDGGDLFTTRAGVALSAETNPSTRMWDTSDSGLTLSNISGPGEVIRFTVGGVEQPAELIRGEAAPAAAIPDKKKAGISSKIHIGQTGHARTIAVAVDISHTWIGDLTVELTSPSGRTVRLHNRTGRNQQDLLVTYTSAEHAGLAAQVGESIQGDWVLRVADRARRDIGKLNRWTIELGVAVAVEPLRANASPNLTIPDNTTAGVADVLAFTHSGVARRVKATVEIAHTWIGDLRIELLSPAGRSTVLHGQIGGSQENLNAMYDSEAPGSPLAGMVGESIAGNWTLRITDRAARDTGTLKKWSMELTPT